MEAAQQIFAMRMSDSALMNRLGRMRARNGLMRRTAIGQSAGAVEASWRFDRHVGLFRESSPCLPPELSQTFRESRQVALSRDLGEAAGEVRRIEKRNVMLGSMNWQAVQIEPLDLVKEDG